MKLQPPIAFFIVFFIFDLCATDVTGQRRKAKPNKNTITVSAHEPTPEEKRKSAESRILKGEYYHDGAGILLYVGTIESVPALMKILKDVPPVIVGANGRGTPYRPVPGKPDGIDRSKLTYVCTTAHAIAALKKITGQYFATYEEWNDWWNKRDK